MAGFAATFFSRQNAGPLHALTLFGPENQDSKQALCDGRAVKVVAFPIERRFLRIELTNWRF
jgi:hypothetical protein